MLDQFNPRSLYDIYRVKLAVRDRIVGGMPKNPELIKAWVESTRPDGEPVDEAKTAALIQEDAELIVNAVAEKMWTGFPEDKDGIFMPARQVKAMLKQSASVLRITEQKRGSKQILAEGMEVKALDGSDRLRLGKAPSGNEERAIHVKTAQGPRTALKRFDYVTKPVLEMEIWVLHTAGQEKRHIGQKELTSILMHAQENGLGASRSQGEGKFDVVEFQAPATDET